MPYLAGNFDAASHLDYPAGPAWTCFGKLCRRWIDEDALLAKLGRKTTGRSVPKLCVPNLMVHFKSDASVREFTPYTPCSPSWKLSDTRRMSDVDTICSEESDDVDYFGKDDFTPASMSSSDSWDAILGASF